jgi:nitrogen-specific signal transduction histidine kinase
MRSLIAALVATTLVVSAALGWAGWRLLDQERALDEQRTRDRIESAADALAAGIRGKLAEAGERLSGWLSDPSAPVPAIGGAVVVGVRPDSTDVTPAGELPFVPAVPLPRIADALLAVESIEFAGPVNRAADEYRRLADQGAPELRAGALLRLGRVQRKIRDHAGALVTYQRLSELGAVRTDDLPAELAGLTGLRATHAAMGNRKRSDEVSQRISKGIDSGRWQIARGTAELYRETFMQPPSEAWRLANALSETWRDADGRLSARGQRVFVGSDGPGPSVLVAWRSSGTATVALAASADRFFELPTAVHTGWQLIDAEGRVICGPASTPSRSVAHIIGNAEYPWTLHTWVTSPPLPVGTPSSRTVLIAMMAAMFAFVWGACYFMARAIRREAAVARLQSDFVAAVSHEFRSPLTTVRQMAEMLDEDRVPTEERRHKYYRILAAEAARLQRLVETLLNFGRMESGAERYRFADLDASALVREVVTEIAPRARESGKTIEIDGPDAMRVRADQDALSMALRNLIDNAIKYSPGQPTVWVRWRQDDARAAICVVDRGVGIPRSEHRTVFDRFARGRAAIEANIKGTGVGLSMVQQIVTAHGGEIRVESEPGRGSTFTLLLPAVH